LRVLAAYGFFGFSGFSRFSGFWVLQVRGAMGWRIEFNDEPEEPRT
jgi:hypothetical protein